MGEGGEVGNLSEGGTSRSEAGVGGNKSYMLLEVSPNIWLEIHSSLMVSNSIPAQRAREKTKGEERLKKQGERREKEKKKEDGAKKQSILQVQASHDTRPLSA